MKKVKSTGKAKGRTAAATPQQTTSRPTKGYQPSTNLARSRRASSAASSKWLTENCATVKSNAWDATLPPLPIPKRRISTHLYPGIFERYELCGLHRASRSHHRFVSDSVPQYQPNALRAEKALHRSAHRHEQGGRVGDDQRRVGHHAP